MVTNVRILRWLLVISTLIPVSAFAQHLEIGIFGNYDRQDIPNAAENLLGVGGRADVNITRIIQMEVELAYDFKNPHFVTSTQPNAVLLNSTELGILHANAGLKIQTKGGSLFGFVKGGANRYDTEAKVETLTAIPLGITTSQVPGRSFSKGVLYPGAGLGFHAGPLGIRMDAGDEITWIDGSMHNSLRVTFGPTIKF